jgi:hypothetical protein
MCAQMATAQDGIISMTNMNYLLCKSAKEKKKKEKRPNKVSHLIPPPLKYVSLKVHHVSRQKGQRAPYGMLLNVRLLYIVPGGPHMNFVGLALDLQLEGGTWPKDLKIGNNIFLVMYGWFEVVTYQLLVSSF